MCGIKLNEVQLKILKYMYDNNQDIVRNNGWSKYKIIKRAEVEKGEGKETILFLADSGLINKQVEKYSRQTGHKSKPIDKYPVSKKISGEVTKFRISPKGREFIEKEMAQMKVAENLQKMIDEDIQKCGNPSIELAEELIAKYKSYIDGVKEINIGWLDVGGESTRVVKAIKSALIAYKAFGYKNKNDNIPEPKVFIHNRNENINKNTISINITFEQVREEIKSNGHLSVDQVDDILNRIDELEKINGEEKGKSRKWKKLKGVFEWLSRQGVEIAVKILPLILKMITEE